MSYTLEQWCNNKKYTIIKKIIKLKTYKLRLPDSIRQVACYSYSGVCDFAQIIKGVHRKHKLHAALILLMLNP